MRMITSKSQDLKQRLNLKMERGRIFKKKKKTTNIILLHGDMLEDTVLFSFG